VCKAVPEPLTGEVSTGLVCRDDRAPAADTNRYASHRCTGQAEDVCVQPTGLDNSTIEAPAPGGDDESGEFMDLMQSASDFPDEPIQRQELQESVQRTVMSMPDHLREILLLSYFHQFPYKQISDILDIPLGTVKSRLHAAVAHFADRWKTVNQNRALS
jgi:RNA polymerase sigma-70 factor (ECF subfamily)